MLADDQAIPHEKKLLDALVRVCNSVVPTSTLQRLLISCEIPMLLLGFRAENSPRVAPWETIIDRLGSICDEAFDGEGMMASSELSDFAEVLASLARMIQLANLVNPGVRLPNGILHQFQWAVRQLLLIYFADGLLLGGQPRQLGDDLIAVLLKLGGDPSDVRLARHLGLLWDSEGAFAAELAIGAKRPQASFHSEWAQVAVLRSGWGRNRRELGVRVDGTRVELALQSCGAPVLRGAMEFVLEVDGVCVKPAGKWIETCWQSDSDADYLEIELEMNDGWRIQRQFCVSRRSGAVLIADVVLGSTISDVRQTIKLKAASDATFNPAGDGRELFVVTGNLKGLVLPVGLPEWQNERSGGISGDLTAVKGLELTSSGAQCSALYCPLFFALTPKANKKPYTWRRLFVAKNLKHEAEGQAAAVRIQVGGRQWLLYRSLTEQGNRTFMGQNYASEFVFGEFLLDGSLKPYVEIE
ncbi:MAG: hypothetical protein HOB73_02900 [Planctomycetaceae bacterium]|nr:hypothetical protein [Planctomycetaceae bacterium]